MPPLIRFLIRHGLIGFCIGVAFTAVLLVLDVANLRTLTRGAPEGTGVRLLLAFFVSTTFASAQMGIAVMFPPSRKVDPTAPPSIQAFCVPIVCLSYKLGCQRYVNKLLNMFLQKDRNHDIWEADVKLLLEHRELFEIL